eukprot:Awhi_evm1s20
MQSFFGLVALVGVVSASKSYECFSVDKRADNYWCQQNCLDLEGRFNEHPACFVDYEDRSVHTVCQCEAGNVGKGNDYKEYMVKITNLAFNQPLSRPVIFTHNEKKQLFKFNGKAGKGLRVVAEDGNP